MEDKMKETDTMLREHFSRIGDCPMPEGLRVRIVAQAASRRRRVESILGRLSVAAYCAAVVAVGVWLAVTFLGDQIKDVIEMVASIELSVLSLPAIDMDNNVMAIGFCLLALFVGQMAIGIAVSKKHCQPQP